MRRVYYSKDAFKRRFEFVRNEKCFSQSVCTFCPFHVFIRIVYRHFLLNWWMSAGSLLSEYDSLAFCRIWLHLYSITAQSHCCSSLTITDSKKKWLPVYSTYGYFQAMAHLTTAFQRRNTTWHLSKVQVRVFAVSWCSFLIFATAIYLLWSECFVRYFQSRFIFI